MSERLEHIKKALGALNCAGRLLNAAAGETDDVDLAAALVDVERAVNAINRARVESVSAGAESRLLDAEALAVRRGFRP